MNMKRKQSHQTDYGIRKEKDSGKDSTGQSSIVLKKTAIMKSFLESPESLRGRWWKHQTILKGQNDHHGTVEILIRHINHKDSRDFFPNTVDDIVDRCYRSLLRNFTVTETRAIETKGKRRSR